MRFISQNIDKNTLNQNVINGLRIRWLKIIIGSAIGKTHIALSSKGFRL